MTFPAASRRCFQLSPLLLMGLLIGSGLLLFASQPGTQTDDKKTADKKVADKTVDDKKTAQPTPQKEPSLKAACIRGTGHGWKKITKDDFMDVNGTKDTWTWKGDVIHCTGEPRGVIALKKIYTNFECVIEWKHKEAGGNSGLFVWAPTKRIDALKKSKSPGLPGGIEVQILDVQYQKIYRDAYKQGKPVRPHQKKPPKRAPGWFTCHGDVFPVGPGVKMTPFPPLGPVDKRGRRSFPSKNLTKGTNEWNHYYLRCINGEIRLWVNGEEVSGGKDCQPRTGYFCLESEQAPIEFRNLRIRELP